MKQSRSNNPVVDVFLRIEPDIPKLTHQNGVEPGVLGNGKPYMHKTRELEELEAFYVSHLKKVAPPQPWTCPVHLTTIWKFRRPKKAKGKFKTTKPDTHNIVKTFVDCMKTAGFFKDDNLVAVETIAKYWEDPDRPHGICIVMRDLTDENE